MRLQTLFNGYSLLFRHEIRFTGFRTIYPCQYCYVDLNTSGNGSTLSRDCTTNSLELSISVTLAPLSKGVGASEELMVHLSHEIIARHFQLREAPTNRTNRYLNENILILTP